MRVNIKESTSRWPRRSRDKKHTGLTLSDTTIVAQLTPQDRQDFHLVIREVQGVQRGNVNIGERDDNFPDEFPLILRRILWFIDRRRRALGGFRQSVVLRVVLLRYLQKGGRRVPKYIRNHFSYCTEKTKCFDYRTKFDCDWVVMVSIFSVK